MRKGVSMTFALRQALIYENGKFLKSDALIHDGKAERIGNIPEGIPVAENCMIIPGLADVHVHFREPGFTYKETILTGTAAAAHGGYTAVCSMPNLYPVPDCPAHLSVQMHAIEKDARIRVYPYGSVTVGEKGQQLSDMAALADKVCAFSDDGHGIQNREIMREAMLRAASLGKMIVAHCEDTELVNGGYIHAGKYAAAHGHRGISSASEYTQIERDLQLAKETGCAYHVCHISTKESVALIRSAKAAGVNVTCETAPHYLTLTEQDLQEDGKFKMNPPLRCEADRQALIEGILDGTIDMIATDHAPHSAEEKAKGLKGSVMGITGLETAFPVLYTALVRTGILTMEKLILLMSVNPRKRFGIDTANDFAVMETATPYVISSSDFLSKGKCTPFEGMRVYGRCMTTVCGGKTVWQKNITES